MRLAAIAVVITLLAVVGLAACLPAEPSGTVRGFVFYSGGPPNSDGTGGATDGKPVNDSAVRLVADGETIAETRTGSDGRYIMEAPAGSYSLEGDCIAQDSRPVDLEAGATISADLTCVIA